MGSFGNLSRRSPLGSFGKFDILEASFILHQGILHLG